MQFAPGTGGCAPQPCAVVLESNVLAALDFVHANLENYKAAGKGVAAVNLSLGIGSEQHAIHCSDTAPHLGLNHAMRKLRQAGVATIISSGTSSLDGFVSNPACLPEAIAVGASNDEDALWIFGNLGPLVKLMAPGVDIASAVPAGSACAASGQRICELSGTSQAAPHVAGALALLRSSKPKARISEMLAALNCTGRPVQGYDAFHESDKFHRPHINVAAAEAHLSDPDGGKSFRLSASAGRWQPVHGNWTVADGDFRTGRIDDKVFGNGTLADEVTLCSGSVAELNLDRFHELRVIVDPGAMSFHLDGTELCTLSNKDQPPRYAPPAKIALVARRGVTGTYIFSVDAVTTTAQ